MTVSVASVEELLAQAVPGQQVVIHFADGSAVVRGGYRTVESALFGPLGVQHCFRGTPSPGLQHEIDWRGQALIAAVGAAEGTTLLIDGQSVWAADVTWDPAPSLETLLAQRTQAQLLGGPGVPPEAEPAPSPAPAPEPELEPVTGAAASAAASPEAAGPQRAAGSGGRRPPPPARPRRPAPPARPPGSAASTRPPGAAAPDDPAPTTTPGATTPTGDGADWVDRILAAEPVRLRAGRRRLSAADIRSLLLVLDRHGTGGVPFAALAQEAGLAERRVPGYLAQLSEIVNIDGYEVITVSAQSARFDRALLERQLRGDL